jgi:hypothetical protein
MPVGNLNQLIDTTANRQSAIGNRQYLQSAIKMILLAFRESYGIDGTYPAAEANDSSP